MNFLSIEYFITLEEERNFSKAADRLHITQQTLSASISRLESEINNKLFLRSVPLKLTYAGTIFLQYARQIQQKHLELTRELNDISENVRGEIKVGIGYAIGRKILPSVIADFTKKYPGYSIQIKEMPNELLKEHLLDHNIDLAIGSFDDNLPGIFLQSFFEEEIVLLVSEKLLMSIYKDDYSQIYKSFIDHDFSEMQKCPFILCPPELMVGIISRRFFQKYNITPNVKVHTRNIDTLISMCESGIGAGFCPDILLNTNSTDNTLSDLKIFHLGNKSKYPISIATLSHTYCGTVMNSFIEYLINSVLPH